MTLLRHIGAIGGVERVKSNWEGVESCQQIEGMTSSPDTMYVMTNTSFSFKTMHLYIILMTGLCPLTQLLAKMISFIAGL